MSSTSHPQVPKLKTLGLEKVNLTSSRASPPAGPRGGLKRVPRPVLKKGWGDGWKSPLAEEVTSQQASNLRKPKYKWTLRRDARSPSQGSLGGPWEHTTVRQAGRGLGRTAGHTRKVAPRAASQGGGGRAAQGMDAGLSLGSGPPLGADWSLRGSGPAGRARALRVRPCPEAAPGGR